ncbi:TolC family outer membrane protein [Sphingomonas sp. RG327]|uniref:TolC family outer membrane protein n=1 Tax=Sphingomonas anseongensis TaxID=2908207 RepID=A0ABT0RES6_9SPHN|nr:TolC family outer membrane protein [Sphingomonas anseongensis]
MTRFRLLLTGSMLAALAGGTAAADTLREALVSTYETNPTITAQREALKATDASVAIARAQGRPHLSATAGINQDLSRSGILDTGASGPTLSVGADVSMPLFAGGRISNSIKAAKTRVEAGRALLRGTEGDVFTQAVAAYMDVIRDRAIVELNQNNVKVLETNLEATRDRFEIGDVTRTDVAQSEARLELGRANLATARGRASSSEQEYRRVIGHEPGQLAPPPPLPPLPATPEEAVRIALANNPDIVAANRQARAAGYDVSVARAQRLPTLSAVGRGTYVNEIGGTIGNLPSTGGQTSVGLETTVPIYQGGEAGARIREAQAFEGQTLEQAVGTERSVVAQARSAFATYQAATDAIAANEVAMRANELALEGARAERSVGTRTVLDVLNAEQELLNSQVALVTAKRDQYVAGFELLNAMGQAEAQDLGLDGGPLYDPLGNYRRVAGDWNDWSSDPRHLPKATRTVTPAEAGVAPATQGVTPPPQ